jgi:tetratricopeptide (TPR) repeat protein
MPYNSAMKICIIAVSALLAFAPALAHGQTPQKLFESGKYQQVVESTPPDAPPPAIYVAAQSQQKLGANDQAVQLYDRLAQLPQDDAWHFVGESGRQLVGGDVDGAINAARRAVDMNDGLLEAHYQLGLALARREDWSGAAAQFDAAVNINPSNAYAHYYDGLMQYRAGRTDLMAIHFEQFMKLAPDAPERPEVAQIMRTVRGR